MSAFDWPNFNDAQGFALRKEQFKTWAMSDEEAKIAAFYYQLGVIDGTSWARYQLFLKSGKTMKEFFSEEHQA